MPEQQVEKDSFVVERAVKYRLQFPESEVTDIQLIRHFWNGGAVADCGALYQPDVGIPEGIPDDKERKEPLFHPLKVSISELAEAHISYHIRGKETPFRREITEHEDFVVEGDGELRGIHIREEPDTDGLLEPLTRGEADEFIEKVSPGVWKHPLITAVDVVEDFLQFTQMYNFKVRENEERLSAWTLFNIEPEFFQRARASAQRNNIGETWSFQSVWFIGAREGTTVGIEAQNDREHTKLDQHHQLGEQVDGQRLFFEELRAAEEENLFNQLFDRNKRDEQGKLITASDGGPINRGWSERNLYLWRQAHSRGERFAEKLWRILTWPRHLVERGIEDLNDQYRQDIRKNAPGPGRSKVGGRWKNVPLEGNSALDWLRRRGTGTMAGKPVNLAELRVWKGEEWHKNMFNKEHMDELNRAAERRAGRIHLNIGGEKVVEDVPVYDGLPIEYIRARYR